MKSSGEIEAAVSVGMTRFEQEYMGHGPRNVRTHLVDDLLLVRMHGVLTAAERQLVKTQQPEKCRDLLKQVRTQLMEAARPILEAMIHEAAGVRVRSVHHDISTITGEELVLFTLTSPPPLREPKKHGVNRSD